MTDDAVKKTLVILAGPTAVGKTKLSISLAKALNGEIISADSMQVYRRMNIGTAKISEAEKQGIPHYLIDCLSPEEDFHVVRFVSLAKEAMEQIYAKGKLPIVVGGTGFYIQALLYDIDFTENDEDMSYREYLDRFSKEHGAEALHQMLKEVDEKAASEIHPNNIKRVIRALEFYKKSGGMRISEHNEEQRKKESPYNFAYFVLTDDRALLYERIDARVDEMLKQGLVKEVQELLQDGVPRTGVSMQGLGYKEIAAYLCGECTYEEAVYLLKRDTRHFAKRQLTWFRREPEVLWMNRQDFGNSEQRILEEMIKAVKERKIGA
ncbi:MAG: tRNA (adenosine(37)-N6)-dimethylallyltransferase MiaA [Lachnospiraceae bacterium]